MAFPLYSWCKIQINFRTIYSGIWFFLIISLKKCSCLSGYPRCFAGFFMSLPACPGSAGDVAGVQVPYAFQWYMRGSVTAAIGSSPGLFTSALIVCRPSLIAKYTASGFTSSGNFLIVLCNGPLPYDAVAGFGWDPPWNNASYPAPSFFLLLFRLRQEIAGNALEDRYTLTFQKKIQDLPAC